jgi:hypothetical protein
MRHHFARNAAVLLSAVTLFATEARTSRIAPPLRELVVSAEIRHVEESVRDVGEDGVDWKLEAKPGKPKLGGREAPRDTLVRAAPKKVLSETTYEWEKIDRELWVLVPKAVATVGRRIEIVVSQYQETKVTQGKGPAMLRGGRLHVTTWFKGEDPG